MKVLAGLCLLATGCFYLDPLNKPPNLIVDCELTEARPCRHQGTDVRRGDRIRLIMSVSDPDGNEDPSSYGWEAFACGSTTGSECATEPFDAQHYDEPAERGLEVDVPMTLATDVRSISVDFEARDDRGGITTQSLVFQLTGAPTLPRNATEASAALPSRTMYLRRR